MAIKILLADDSLTIQKVVELTFSDAETRLMAVGSGDRAVLALDDFQPDLVLADVVMPGLSGYDVCEAVKQRPGGAFVPVVLLTGTFEPFDRGRAERVGSDAIVTKPFDSHALQGLVRDLVEKSRLAREAAEAEAAAAAAVPVAAPVAAPEPPPTMVLSAEDLAGEFPAPAPIPVDVASTLVLTPLDLAELAPPPFVEAATAAPEEESLYSTMAMPALSGGGFDEPSAVEPPPQPAFHEPEAAFETDAAFGTEPPPPPPAAFAEPEPAFVPPPPPAFYEPEPAFETDAAFETEPPPPPPPAYAEPEPAFVPPPPPPPPAFYEPEPEPGSEPGPDTAPLALTEATFEVAADAETGPIAGEIEVELEDEPYEPPPAPAPAAVVEEAAEPFPEMDEPAPMEAEAAPWDEVPVAEIPPPPPELAGAPSEADSAEPITRDLDADLAAFEASGLVRRRPEIWERHAALIGEEVPDDIDIHTSAQAEAAEPEVSAGSSESSELEEIAAAARLEDLSKLIPVSASVPAEAAPAAAEGAAAPSGALSDGDVDRIARRVVELLSDRIVRDIAWEVVPEYAERLVRERIAEVERAG